jgi:hypothetical protein
MYFFKFLAEKLELWDGEDAGKRCIYLILLTTSTKNLFAVLVLL